MSYLSRNRISRIFIPRIFGSPIAFFGTLLALASLAATAFALSSRAPNSLAVSLADYVSAICSQRFQSASPAEASYLAENVDAMTKMMFDMGIRPSGDIDSDFVAMMTPHVNIVRNANGMFAYVTIGGLNEVQVYRTDDFSKVATIPVGRLPHGIWPSGDGTRVYVGLENQDGLTAIDTLTNKVIATSPVGQTPQAVVYVPQAVPADAGTGNAAMSVMDRSPPGAETQGLQPLGIAGQTTQLWLEPPGQGVTAGGAKALTSVTLFDQGLVQVLEAAVTGLEPRKPYVLALANEPSGGGVLESLQAFMTNPAGSTIVNAIGPIRQVVQGADEIPRRYLAIVPGAAEDHGAAVQVQRQ
jgi:YVTN family beta-propeller protein